MLDLYLDFMKFTGEKVDLCTKLFLTDFPMTE